MGADPEKKQKCSRKSQRLSFLSPFSPNHFAFSPLLWRGRVRHTMPDSAIGDFSAAPQLSEPLAAKNIQASDLHLNSPQCSASIYHLLLEVQSGQACRASARQAFCRALIFLCYFLFIKKKKVRRETNHQKNTPLMSQNP